ncbi:hypothetical protein [Pendulispora albinea]|uniref:Lipoprotein n=1 Tax=Pendulispora albinea TaxID=2741071 RepID=A0ABZ2MBZ9_9BACT
MSRRAMLFAGVLLVGCARQPEHRPAAAPPVAEGPSMLVSIVRAEGGPRASGAVVDARSRSGALLLVRGPSQPRGAATVARLGAERAVSKIQNVVRLLDTIEASREPDPELHVFLQVDRARATHTSLASLGFAADTLAGDVATGWVRVTALERVLASDIVQRLEPPDTVHLR